MTFLLSLHEDKCEVLCRNMPCIAAQRRMNYTRRAISLIYTNSQLLLATESNFSYASKSCFLCGPSLGYIMNIGFDCSWLHVAFYIIIHLLLGMVCLYLQIRNICTSIASVKVSRSDEVTGESNPNTIESGQKQ